MTFVSLCKILVNGVTCFLALIKRLRSIINNQWCSYIEYQMNLKSVIRLSFYPLLTLNNKPNVYFEIKCCCHTTLQQGLGYGLATSQHFSMQVIKKQECTKKAKLYTNCCEKCDKSLAKMLKYHYCFRRHYDVVWWVENEFKLHMVNLILGRSVTNRSTLSKIEIYSLNIGHLWTPFLSLIQIEFLFYTHLMSIIL